VFKRVGCPQGLMIIAHSCDPVPEAELKISGDKYRPKIQDRA